MPRTPRRGRRRRCSRATSARCVWSRTSTRSREMRLAVDATELGFDDVIADLPADRRRTRAANASSRAPSTGAPAPTATQVGYDTIAASGPHACILHWTRNDGPVVAGDLILLDAGVELRLALHGRHHAHPADRRHVHADVQRRVYEAVLEAADARVRDREAGHPLPRGARGRHDRHRPQDRRVGLPAGERRGVARPRPAVPPPLHGARHEPPPRASTCTTARRRGASSTSTARCTRAWSSRSSPASTSSPTTSRFRRSSAASACASRTTSLVTADGCENLSAGIPRTADEVEAWMRG